NSGVKKTVVEQPVNVIEEEDESAEDDYEFINRVKWKNVEEGLEESLPKMVDDRVKELTKTQVPLYVAEGLILERKHNQADVAKMIAYAIQQDCKNLWAEITLQINNAITNHIPSQVDSSVRSSAIHPSDQDDPHDDAHLEGENNAKSRRHLRMELISLENLHLVKLMKVNQKTNFNVTISTKATPVVQSCQRDPKAPALSLVNQDLLYLKKGNSGLEKFVLSLHKFHAVIFSDDDIKERTSKWVDKCVKKFNPYALYNVEHWKNSHAKIFYIKRKKNQESQLKKSTQIQRLFTSSKPMAN
ncbi:hypothetical protein Tco_0295402, partial [Tanacetum coccineum]